MPDNEMTPEQAFKSEVDDALDYVEKIGEKLIERAGKIEKQLPRALAMAAAKAFDATLKAAATGFRLATDIPDDYLGDED